MLVKDPGLMGYLMKSREPKITARQMSRDLGFASHSYMNRILSGEVTTIADDRAVQIAYLLRVPVELLFDPSVSSDIRQSAKERPTSVARRQPAQRRESRGGATR